MPGGGIPIGAPRPGGIPIGGPIGGRMPGGGPIIPTEGRSPVNTHFTKAETQCLQLAEQRRRSCSKFIMLNSTFIMLHSTVIILYSSH